MRWYRLIRPTLVATAAFGAVAAAAQEGEDSRPAQPRRETAEQEAVLEECATVPGATDFMVIDDRHVYLRTRGSNHYLLRTEFCENLKSSFIRREVSLVPYGRRVCENDGSYILYLDAGRTRTCHIESVQRVDSRNAARELAAGPSPAVTAEPVELDADRRAEPAQPR
jgi:hypothetical protein